MSVVMPKEDINPHTDWQYPDWITRIHIPLTTNPLSFHNTDGVDFHMDVGMVYMVNPTILHHVHNDGDTPRIHLMFDVRENGIHHQ